MYCHSIYSFTLPTIKDKNGKLLGNSTDIKNRWKQYYEDLYNESSPVDNTVLNEITPSNGYEHMGDILGEEVEAAIGNGLET